MESNWVNDIINKKTTCKHCLFISALFPPANDMTPREYYTFTEVFCYLHDDKGECDGQQK